MAAETGAVLLPRLLEFISSILMSHSFGVRLTFMNSFQRRFESCTCKFPYPFRQFLRISLRVLIRGNFENRRESTPLRLLRNVRRIPLVHPNDHDDAMELSRCEEEYHINQIVLCSIVVLHLNTTVAMHKFLYVRQCVHWMMSKNWHSLKLSTFPDE